MLWRVQHLFGSFNRRADLILHKAGQGSHYVHGLVMVIHPCLSIVAHFGGRWRQGLKKRNLFYEAVECILKSLYNFVLGRTRRHDIWMCSLVDLVGANNALRLIDFGCRLLSRLNCLGLREDVQQRRCLMLLLWPLVCCVLFATGLDSET